MATAEITRVGAWRAEFTESSRIHHAKNTFVVYGLIAGDAHPEVASIPMATTQMLAEA